MCDCDREEECDIKTVSQPALPPLSDNLQGRQAAHTYQHFIIFTDTRPLTAVDKLVSPVCPQLSQ